MAAPRRLRVVIADDHLALLDSIEHQLNLDGRFVVIGKAGDGRAAIDFAVAGDADVVVMDLRMPEMDGADATRRLHDIRPQTKVVMISGLDSAEEHEQAAAAGAFSFLSKEQVAAGELADAIIAASADGASLADCARVAR